MELITKALHGRKLRLFQKLKPELLHGQIPGSHWNLLSLFLKKNTEYFSLCPFIRTAEKALFGCGSEKALHGCGSQTESLPCQHPGNQAGMWAAVFPRLLRNVLTRTEVHSDPSSSLCPGRDSSFLFITRLTISDLLSKRITVIIKLNLLEQSTCKC